MEPITPNSPARWTNRQVALATLVVVAVACAFWIIFRFRLVFFSLFTAIVLSTAFTPLVDRLARWGISRKVAIILISLAVVLAVVVMVMTIVPLLIEQGATLTTLLTRWYADIHTSLLNSPSLVIQRIARQLPAGLPLTLPPPDIEEAVEENSLTLIQQAANIGSAVLRSLLIILAVGLLTNFWILEGDRIKRFVLLAIPVDRREQTRDYLAEIENKVGDYTRGLVILSLIIGAMALVSYLIIGLPNALFLAIIAGIMEAVPLVGPTIGAIPALLVAASTDPDKIIWVIIATMIFQALENNLIAPRVMDRAVGINPVASLLAFIAFGSIFGFTGAILAIPLAAVIQISLKHFLFKSNPTEQAPPVRRDAISALRYDAQDLVADVRKQVRVKESDLDSHADQFEDALEAVIQDLDSILAQVETDRQNMDNGQGEQSR